MLRKHLNRFALGLVGAFLLGACSIGDSVGGEDVRAPEENTGKISETDSEAKSAAKTAAGLPILERKIVNVGKYMSRWEAENQYHLHYYGEIYEYGRVINVVSKLNVRRAPSIDSKVIGYMNPNEECYVEYRAYKWDTDGDDWYLVIYAVDGTADKAMRGWVNANYLTIPD